MTATKQPGEGFTFTYDFADRLAGATIASIAGVTQVARRGGMPMVKAGEQVSGTRVLVFWDGGADGEEYLTTVSVVASDGSRLELDGLIAVRAVGFELEPVTLAEAQDQLRVDPGAHDRQITRHIAAAREWVEGYTGHILTARQLAQPASGFGNWIELAAWPVRAVVAVSYLDTGGVQQVLPAQNYQLGTHFRPARIYAAAGMRWPAVLSSPGSVLVLIDAGYETPADVPDAFKVAILVLCQAMFDTPHDMAAAENTARILCRRYRRHRV